jgi:DNA-binding CsgD family transcriptional regulator
MSTAACSSPAAQLADPPFTMSETQQDAGSLEIHLHPQNEQELESLLDTVTALMSQRVREHRSDRLDIPAAWPPEMSERETEILQLIADGATAASAALALHLSVHTVRSHVRNARSKLKSTTVSQAVAVAIMLGMVTPKPPPAATQALNGDGELLLLDP